MEKKTLLDHLDWHGDAKHSTAMKNQFFVLLDNNRQDEHRSENSSKTQQPPKAKEEKKDLSKGQKGNLLFRNPKRFIIAYSPNDVDDAFLEIEAARKAGDFVAGSFSYELGYYFSPPRSNTDGKLYNNPANTDLGIPTDDTSFPLICLGIFSKVELLSEKEVETFLATHPFHAENSRLHLKPFDNTAGKNRLIGKNTHKDANFPPSKKQYNGMYRAIKKEIVDGNTYQVNLCLRHRYSLASKANLSQLYRMLRQAQRVEFGAFVHLPGVVALSRSPELFFTKNRDDLCMRPMKGTAAPSKTALDKDNSYRQLNSEKNKAENRMIVDLLRNDLSRIAKTGTVKVEKLFDVERYETVHQLTSTIKCKLRPEIGIKQLFSALYPCGSITGAPKINTMEIIARNEKNYRQLFTGAIGYITPEKINTDAKKTNKKQRLKTIEGNKTTALKIAPLLAKENTDFDNNATMPNEMCFNVAIRTLQLCYQKKEGYCLDYGVGSGVTIASNAKEEYAEIEMKTRFITKALSSFCRSEDKKGNDQTADANAKPLHRNAIGIGEKNSSHIFQQSFNTDESDSFYLFETMRAKFEMLESLGQTLAQAVSNKATAELEKMLVMIIPFLQQHFSRLQRSARCVSRNPKKFGLRDFTPLLKKNREELLVKLGQFLCEQALPNTSYRNSNGQAFKVNAPFKEKGNTDLKTDIFLKVKMQLFRQGRVGLSCVAVKDSCPPLASLPRVEVASALAPQATANGLSRLKRLPMVGISSKILHMPNAERVLKSSKRKLYEEQYELALESGLTDLVFFNQYDQLCEATRHNVFIYLNGKWQTPAISCGALPGVQRQLLLKNGKVETAIISRIQFLQADAIALSNAVRGVYLVRLQKA